MKSQQQQKLFVTRKSSSKQHFALTSMDDWTEEDDALLYGRRYVSDPIATTANVAKVRLLQEFFPGTDREILQDVLIAAQFQVDVAAAMLGDLVRETTQRQFAAEEDQAVTAAIQSEMRPVVVLDVEMNDMDDEEDEDWSEVSTIVQQQEEEELSAVEVHPWVMVQDEWEVVDMEGEKVHTFAEVLRRSAVNTPYVSQLPKLTIIEPETSQSQKTKTKKKKNASYKTEPVAFDSCERSVKSFGARKRRFLKTRA